MPTVKVEEDFMRSLLDDLDTSIAGSIPPVTPRKSKKAKYATPKKRTPLRKVKLEDEEKCLKLQRMSVDIKDVDLDALLDGAADWEDMSDDDVKTETGVGVGTKTRIRTPMSAKKKLLRHSCSPLRIRTPKKKSIVPSGALSYMSVKLEEVDMKALLEGINDEWDDVLEEDVKPAPKPKATYVPPTRSSLGKTRLLPPPKYVREPSTKCVVDAVAVVENNCKMEKHLVVKVDKSGETRLVFLQGEWAQTDVRAGDTINIIGSFDQPSPSGPPVPSITLNFHNLLVLHPDILISATSISNTWQCSRRPLIADLVKNTSEITPALVWGNTLHEVMQTCLAEENWDKQFIENKIDEAVMKSLHLLVQIDVGIEAAKVELRARAKGLEEFSQLYISDKPKPNAYLSDHRSQGRRPLLALTGVHDIEEEIWSPTYGLKGKIDASMQARIAEEGSLQREETCWSVPFEIKTGRTLAGMEHRAQTMLYTLLMSERYGEHPSLAYY
ncbi:hypothetical protein BOTBODRAFT_422243 [Botryobasidium botryosum FD-172 SS1]|uniref:DNA replication factor Dna2 N-terminal domain-containing protein n=1 Tax=Botryobasidium botryosum (strain FD-172 SS1) TaxID=930990 RepID=A0A067MKI1_BOTB1|nr:hypothetical protein BOTBODRAFT_422243 [Botryobasidium botryosum FD-172 SS1]